MVDPSRPLAALARGGRLRRGVAWAGSDQLRGCAPFPGSAVPAVGRARGSGTLAEVGHGEPVAAPQAEGLPSAFSSMPEIQLSQPRDTRGTPEPVHSLWECVPGGCGSDSPRNPPTPDRPATSAPRHTPTPTPAKRKHHHRRRRTSHQHPHQPAVRTRTRHPPQPRPRRPLPQLANPTRHLTNIGASIPGEAHYPWGRVELDPPSWAWWPSLGRWRSADPDPVACACVARGGYRRCRDGGLSDGRDTSRRVGGPATVIVDLSSKGEAVRRSLPTAGRWT